MDIVSFRRILSTFLDAPSSLDISKGHLIAEIHTELVEADLTQRDGVLIVSENGADLPATQWLVRRVARLPLLADRILSHTVADDFFVAPTGRLLDQLENAATEQLELISDVPSSLTTLLERRPAGTASVVYLTSDGGEGKSTLINQLARAQAARYKARNTDWLMLPIALAGRPFLRFDEVVVGALSNKFKFQWIYYEAFLELVKLGVVVPALDGFEEMFVEGAAGDAVSALGSLMQMLESSGTVLIAARKAYFEYKSLQTQAHLYDALRNSSVAFAKVQLDRWTEDQFIAYASLRGHKKPEALYREATDRLGIEHPLLTRAVLVRRLVDVALASDSAGLLTALGQSSDDYLAGFVTAIVEREANEKWIDRSGDPARPLLTPQEHLQLLSFVAVEMWTASTTALRGDVLEFAGDYFSEVTKKDARISGQIRERIKQHSLFVQSQNQKDRFEFDHEEFYHFFLGESLGSILARGQIPELKAMIRRGLLPQLVVESAVRYLRRKRADVSAAAATLLAAADGELAASHSKENAGATILYLLDGISGDGIVIKGLSFPAEALKNRSLDNVVFQSCLFPPTTLAGANIQNTKFVDCEFVGLDAGTMAGCSSATLDRCRIASFTSSTAEMGIYNPADIRRAILGLGFQIVEDEQVLAHAQEVDRPDDIRVELFARSLRAFIRATEVNELVLRNRMGPRASQFFDDVVPALLKSGVLEHVTYRGHGTQYRYRLSRPLVRINNALHDSEGDFDRCMELLAG